MCLQHTLVPESTVGSDMHTSADDQEIGIVELPQDAISLLQSKAFAYVATLLPDGSPHATETWIDTDGHYVLLNTIVGYRKQRNLERDPRVALVVSDPSDQARHVAIRGRVTSMTTEGATEHIEKLSQRYFGTPYPMHDRGQRLLVRISPTWVHVSLRRNPVR
jgi:PPOX class probable F420-dependent enzyme